MNREKLMKLHRLCAENDLPALEIIVALHIAFDHCENLETNEQYGTKACNAISNWTLE